ESAGNFMEDEQWLSSIAQYSGRIKHWNRFRDDDYIKSWEDTRPLDEALDTTKDPCQKVKCSRHKVCVAQGYQRAMCISRRKLEHRIKAPASWKAREAKEGACRACPGAPLAAVCGSDGHTYSSACKLEQQACLANKQLAVKCEGPCPCPTEHSPTATAARGEQAPGGTGAAGRTPADNAAPADACTGQDLADLGDRLRDWFQLLRENAKLNGSASSPGRVAGTARGAAARGAVARGTLATRGHAHAPAAPAAPERGVAAGCKDATGWMFARLDTSGDGFLAAPELAAINLDKYEACVRAFFNSCDTHADGRVSAAEWCLCFWREKPPCLRELEKVQVLEAAKKQPGEWRAARGGFRGAPPTLPAGAFIPSCDEDGYYRRLQCEQGGGECWCVDQLGQELTGTRGHGRPDCGKSAGLGRAGPVPERPSLPAPLPTAEDVAGFSGDFGSSVGWEDEEEKEPEEAAEEAEEEEEAEADDGGY
ncbi:TICN2 protein, partial [Eudromia elegans]|nr:TICN2 protein [Eudromia elegans]